jgi:uncharacterized HAD superfamily protein
MTIGIDIDDTITNTSELITEYAKKYLGFSEEEVINNIVCAPEITGKILDFYYEYLPQMMAKYTLKANVREVIERLKAKGHKIVIVTARGYTVKSGLIEITKKYFEQHNIIVDKMIFKAKNKVNACLENGINLMIDDSIKVLEDLQKNGVHTLLFNSVSNRGVKTDINRIENWLDLVKYVNQFKC